MNDEYEFTGNQNLRDYSSAGGSSNLPYNSSGSFRGPYEDGEPKYVI